MVDFSHIKKFAPGKETARYQASWLGEGYLTCRIATKDNKDLASAPLDQKFEDALAKYNRLKKKGTNAAMISRAAKRVDIMTTRKLLRTFPKYVVVGWNGVFDTGGNEIDYSEENARDLLRQISEMPSIWEDFIQFVLDPSNFEDVDDDELDDEDFEDDDEDDLSDDERDREEINPTAAPEEALVKNS